MGRGLALAFLLLALAGAGLAFVKPWGWPRGDLIRIQNDRNATERAALDSSLLAVKADLARMTAAKAEAERLAGIERDQATRRLSDLDNHLKAVTARVVEADRATDAARQEIARLAQEIARLSAARDELMTRLTSTQTEAEKAIAEARDDVARARAGQPDNAAEAELEKRLAAVRTEAAERFMAARNEADRQITAAQAEAAQCRAELEKAAAKPTEPTPVAACPPAAGADAAPPNPVISATEIAQHLGTEGHISLYVPFDTGAAVVKPNALPSIEPIAAVLRQDPKLKLLLVGHTDTQGDFGFNRSLSENRAKAIVDQLISKYGIDRARLAYAGVADLAPIASNETEAGRQRNRRVELVRR
jgi:outer membrane protein OmpA-like peptidoglycan-associated protein